MTSTWWRRALTFYAVSFCLTAIIPTFLETNPLRVGIHLTDHMAHWGSAALMAFRGFDVYRKPMRDICVHDDSETPGIESQDICRLPDHPNLRPLGINWQQYPRVYPPGAMLFAAIPAALYALTSISLSTTNLIMILECLLAGHVASLLLLVSLWKPATDAPGGILSSADWNKAVLLLLMPFIHLTLVSWSVLGIYDPISIACVTASVLLLARNRPDVALVAMSAALFFHFRALWYLPILAVAAWQTFDLHMNRRVGAALGISAALLVPTAVAFMLLWPALQGFPLKNPASITVFQQKPIEIVLQGAAPLFVLVFLAFQGSWLTVAVVCWQLFMVTQTHEMRPWHALFLWPWLALAAKEKRGTILGVVAVLLLLLSQSRHDFHMWPLSEEFLVNFKP